MAIPDVIPGLGPTSVIPKTVEGFDFQSADFSTKDYFLFSRVDGVTTLREILLATGLDLDVGVQIVAKLVATSAITLPGILPEEAQKIRKMGASQPDFIDAEDNEVPSETLEKKLSDRARTNPVLAASTFLSKATTSQPKERKNKEAQDLHPEGENETSPRVATDPWLSTEETGKRRSSARALSTTDGWNTPTRNRDNRVTDAKHQWLDIDDWSEAEKNLLVEDNGLSLKQRKRILHQWRQVEVGDPYEILDVDNDVDKKQLKRAYFAKSKEFHPDKFFNIEVGCFVDILSKIFEATTTAYEFLSGSESQGQGESRNDGSSAGTSGQTRQEHARELYERGVACEMEGDSKGAVRWFQAALHSYPKPLYYRRAINCLITEASFDKALVLANQVVTMRPADPSYLRILAEVYAATGRFGEAEAVLVEALRIPADTQGLTVELQKDLEEVRSRNKGSNK